MINRYVLGWRSSVAVVGLILPLLSAPAIAQEAAPASAQTTDPAAPATAAPNQGLADIVVTATKRGDINVQKVAQSIQVLTSESLQRQQIEGFADYARMIPSLSSIDQGPGQTQIVLRGVTTGRINHSQPQNKSTTGLYIDEIPVSSGAFNPDLALFDVERIEVLRGPQGTLYGAGAMSGAIRTLTNAPRLGKTEGLAEGTISTTKSGGENYAGRGLVNLPIGDIAALRVSGYYEHDGGYIDNVYNGDKDYNKDRTYGGRASFKVAPGGNWDFNLNVLYQNLKADGRPDEFLPGDPYTSIVKAPGENTVITDHYQVVKFVEDPFKDRFWIFNGVINGDLGFAKLTSSTSYFDRHSANILDDTYRNRINQKPTLVDGKTGVFVPFYNTTQTHQISNETRLASPGGGTIEWVAGIFYNRQNDRFIQSAPENGLDDLLKLFGLPPSTGFGADPNNVFQGRQSIRQRQVAGFGEVTVNVTDKLSGLVGLRAYHFRQGFDLRYAGIANDGVTTINRSTKDSGVTPKFQINYKPQTNLLVYAQAAKGFRLGGVNEPVPLAGVLGTRCDTALASRGLTGLPPTFGSDTLWNYELGFKGQTTDKRATLNVSAYQIDWKNIQTSVFLPCGFTTVVNAGKARNRGIEGEFRIAPVNDLVLSMSGSYTDAKLVRAGLAFNAQDGDRLPNVPRWLLSGSADYSYPLSGDASLYVRANIQYQSSSFSDFRSTASAIRVPPSTSEDVFFGYRLTAYEISVFVRNLSNERIVTAVDNDRLTPATFSVAPPRTIGVTGRVRF